MRVFASHPLGSDGAGVDAIGVEADAGDDVRTALRSFEQRLGRAGPLKCGRRVWNVKLRGGGI